MFFLDPVTGKPEPVGFSGEESVLDAALKCGVDLPHSCGGMGSCGTCRVLVIENGPAGIPERNEIEQEMASDRGFAPQERLACQLAPSEGLKLSLPHAKAKKAQST